MSEKGNNSMILIDDGREIRDSIFAIRGQQVMVDWDLARLYGVETRVMNQAVKSILLIDNGATVETLDMLAKKREHVVVTVITSAHPDRQGNPRPKISAVDVAKFNAQYPTLVVKFNEKFHDRFLILDDKELYLIGASLKDLGKKCFGFTKMDAGEIAGLKARI